MEPGLYRLIKRNYLKSTDEERLVIQIELWRWFLIDNEGDHLTAMTDVAEYIEHFEEQQDYEICKALTDVIDNYDRLSFIKLR